MKFISLYELWNKDLTEENLSLYVKLVATPLYYTGVKS